MDTNPSLQRSVLENFHPGGTVSGGKEFFGLKKITAQFIEPAGAGGIHPMTLFLCFQYQTSDSPTMNRIQFQPIKIILQHGGSVFGRVRQWLLFSAGAFAF